MHYSIKMDTMKRRHTEARGTAEMTLSVIGGRRKVPILYHLSGNVVRFSELKRKLPGVTQKMMTQQLREMERDGLVKRKVHPQVPPKVEYSLTALGESLKPVVDSMCKWGKLKGAQCPLPRT